MRLTKVERDGLLEALQRDTYGSRGGANQDRVRKGLHKKLVADHLAFWTGRCPEKEALLEARLQWLKGRTRGEWRPCSFLLLFQWMGKVSEVGSLSVDPPHASANPSSRPIASVFFLVPKRKKKTGAFTCSLFFLLFFYLKRKRTREER